jgi:ABC-2 type transport system permease protein
MFLMSTIQNPNDNTVKILSQIPFLTPAFMMIRIPVQRPEWWEIALSITTLVLTIIIVIKISSKIFRLAMLMYGKRPTLKEIVRLVRS